MNATPVVSQLSLQRVLGFPVHVPSSAVPNAPAPHASPSRNSDSHQAGVSADPFAAYLAWLGDRVRSGVGTHTITINAEMIMLGRQDRQFATALQEADLLAPDGAGVVLALKLQGIHIQRCPGIELSERLVAMAASEGWSIYLLGGGPEVSDAVLAQWKQRYPDLALEGHNGYFDADEERVICDRIATLKPQLVFVGTGSPRQEHWIRQHRHLVPEATWIGIGGSLDIWAGTKERAPQWFRDRHLEWLYRLYKEPWRWRRMLALPQFAWYVLVNGVVRQ
ncbi:MAG: WecB/TagA/CpsF family glycosyltransferase [Synechococcus sp.]